MAIMDIEAIMKWLPHRYPFLLVDTITEIEDDKRIVGIKQVTINEPFFQGHFPGSPIMPGVLQLEAMAQVGGVLLNSVHNKPGRIAFFLSVDKARFRRMVKPGDTLRIEVKVLKMRLGICKVHGTCHVGDELASEAELKFGGTG